MDKLSVSSNHKIDPEASIKNTDLNFNFKELVNFYLKSCDHVNHEIYRKTIKKVRRKYQRQKYAELRDAYSRIEPRPVVEDNSLIESKLQKDKNHQLWLERERFAQIEFKAKVEKQKRDLLRIQRKKDLEKRKAKEKVLRKFSSISAVIQVNSR